MKRIRRVPRSVWLALAFVALLDVGIWAVTRYWQPARWSGDPELAALVAERSRLGGYDDDHLQRIRQQATAQAQVAWTRERLAEVGDSFGPQWNCQWLSPQRLTVSRVDPRFREWTLCMRALETWSRQPGATIDSVEIVAGGTSRQRRLACFAFTIAFVVQDGTSDGVRAAPSSGPHPAAVPEGSATSRTVVPSPALRRPSASAEPAASGPGSAPVRPDPSGPLAAPNTNSSHL